MDLTKNFPRSPFSQLDGFVFLPRVIDKARATAAGTNGEYNFDCPMDQAFFGFWGVEAQGFMAQVKEGRDDAALAAYVREHAQARTPEEVKAFTVQLLAKPPADPDKLAYLKQYQESVAPGRTELDSFAKVIAVEENHPLPAFAS